MPRSLEGRKICVSYLRCAAAAALSVALTALTAAVARANENDPTNFFVNCFCSDAVGGNLCVVLKQKVRAVPDYRLANQPLGAGVAIHLVCRDTGVEFKGSQSAVSVAYTVYVDSPNEIFVASAVMLAGAQTVEPTAGEILSTAAKIAAVNASILHRPPTDR